MTLSCILFILIINITAGSTEHSIYDRTNLAEHLPGDLKMTVIIKYNLFQMINSRLKMLNVILP